MEIINKRLKEIDEIEEMVSQEKDVFKSKNLFHCIMGLNELESRVLAYLLKHTNVGTAEITDLLDMDRSSIQRSLQTLTELNLITRKSMSLKEYSELKGQNANNKRGYLYVYNINDIENIKAQFKVLLNKWYKIMSHYIDNLDSLFDCFEIKGELC